MRKVFISVFITVLTFFFFSGCYDAIFQEIRTEVELNEASFIYKFPSEIMRNSLPEPAAENLTILFINPEIEPSLSSTSVRISWKIAS